MRLRVRQTPSGRYFLKDTDTGNILPHIRGMNVLVKFPWFNWEGPVVIPHYPKEENAFDKYYANRPGREEPARELWAREHLELLKLGGWNATGMQADPDLVVGGIGEGIRHVHCMNPFKWYSKELLSDLSWQNGIRILKNKILECKNDFEERQQDPQEAVAAVCDWNEVVWHLILEGIDPELILDVCIPLALEGAKILSDEFKGLVLSSKYAGSIRKPRENGWEGRFNNEGVEYEPDDKKSHFWRLFNAIGESDEIQVIQYNCYGPREQYNLKQLHEVTGKPIYVAEHHYGLWSRQYDERRWLAQELLQTNRSYPLARPQTVQGVLDNFEVVIMDDVEKPFIVGESDYAYSVHASDTRNMKPRYPFGYAWGPVDPTRPSEDGLTEFRDMEWIVGMGAISAKAQQLHEELLRSELN